MISAIAYMVAAYILTRMLDLIFQRAPEAGTHAGSALVVWLAGATCVVTMAAIFVVLNADLDLTEFFRDFYNM